MALTASGIVFSLNSVIIIFWFSNAAAKIQKNIQIWNEVFKQPGS